MSTCDHAVVERLIPALVVVALGAAASGVLVVALVPTITALPRERWAARATSRVFANAALTSLLPGLVALLVTFDARHGLVGAALGGVLAVMQLTARYAPLREVKRLTHSLAVGTPRADVIARLGPSLDRSRPPASDGAQLSTWAHAVLIAAAHLADADEHEAARDVLARTHGLTFKGPSAANLSLLWAQVELGACNLSAARSALASVQGVPAQPLLASYRDALDAVLRAATGDARGALAAMEGWAHADGWHRKLRLTARIVAASVLGDDPACKSAEHELTRRFGARALATARRLVAAASSEVTRP